MLESPQPWPTWVLLWRLGMLGYAHQYFFLLFSPYSFHSLLDSYTGVPATITYGFCSGDLGHWAMPTSISSTINKKQLKSHVTTVKGRGCGDLNKLCRHIDSIDKSHRLNCAWCGEPCYSVYTLCIGKNKKPVPLHFGSKKGLNYMCFMNYHNDNCIGLAKVDDQGPKKKWKEPTKAAKKANELAIEEAKRNYKL